MDLTAINNAISILTRLRELAENISEVEFKNLLADLANELADAKLEISFLKQQIAALTEETNTLKFSGSDRLETPASRGDCLETPKLKWGCYQFENDRGLYCTACYDTKGQKIQTTRLDSVQRSCPVCAAIFGTD